MHRRGGVHPFRAMAGDLLVAARRKAVEKRRDPPAARRADRAICRPQPAI